MGSDVFKITPAGAGKVEIGVRGAEAYDPATGQIHYTSTVTIAELEEALKEAKAAGKKKDADGDPKGFEPRYDASDVRADSSPRSQDRPPIYVSSESNPSPANPNPVPPSSDTERLPSGLANVIGNRNFADAPGPNVATPPEGVEAPTPDEDAIAEAKARQGTVGTELGAPVVASGEDPTLLGGDASSRTPAATAAAKRSHKAKGSSSARRTPAKQSTATPGSAAAKAEGAS